MPLKPSFDRQQNTHLPLVCLAETRKQGLIYHTRGGAVRRQDPGGDRGGMENMERPGQMLQTF